MNIIRMSAAYLPLALVAVSLTVGCARFSYRPVEETEFHRLASEGCTRTGDRFATTAKISSASRETIVLWDGRDGSRTVAVRLPKQGLASRMGGVVGKSRYELGLERLIELRDSNTPITMTLRCESADTAPEADRFSYIDRDGQRVEFEF